MADITDKKSFSPFVAFLCCLVAGVALGFSQPFVLPPWVTTVRNCQNYLGLLSLVGYAPFFWLLTRANPRQAFGYTLLMCVVQHFIALYWIYLAITVYGGVAPPLALLIAVCLPGILGLKMGIFTAMAVLIARRFAISFLWLAPLAVCAAEYFRNYLIFGGFPWSNVGYSLGRVSEFLQLASLVGVYGLVFFVGVINALVVLAFTRRHSRDWYRPLALAAVLLVSVYGFGAYRLTVNLDHGAPKIRVALLQGNIDQDTKSSSGTHGNEIKEIYTAMHKEAQAQGAKLIIWPETSYPWRLRETTEKIDLPNDAPAATILGALTFGRSEKDTDGFHYQNSAMLLDSEGFVKNRFDKTHLVPFAEYVPWPMVGVVDKIVPGMGAFRPGNQLQILKVAVPGGPKLSFGINICYEGIFPDISRGLANLGADLIVNLTNDAWFGWSSAPFQHLLMYRFRSVETGRVYLRATNSGISAWVDPHGHVHKATNLFERALVVDDVPVTSTKTIYNYIGDVVAIFSLSTILILYIAAVFGVYELVRRRMWIKMSFLGSLVMLALITYGYFSGPQFIDDESAITKVVMVSLLALLIAKAAFLGRPKSKMVLVLSLVLFALLCGFFICFTHWYFLALVALSATLYGLTFRKAHQ